MNHTVQANEWEKIIDKKDKTVYSWLSCKLEDDVYVLDPKKLKSFIRQLLLRQKKKTVEKVFDYMEIINKEYRKSVKHLELAGEANGYAHSYAIFTELYNKLKKVL